MVLHKKRRYKTTERGTSVARQTNEQRRVTLVPLSAVVVVVVSTEGKTLVPQFLELPPLIFRLHGVVDYSTI